MLNGENIKLRLIKASDLSMLYEKWHDVEARGLYYPLAVVPEPLLQMAFGKDGFWSSDSKRMLIVDLQDNILGTTHAKAAGYFDCLELSYMIFDKTSRNKGYATEAVKLLIDYFFKHERLNRIQMSIPEGNQASIRVAEKAGFTKEGVARGAFLLNGKDIDLHIYSMLRKEWKA